MQTLQMLDQQNSVEHYPQESPLKSAPLISKIDTQSYKFKTLVSQLKLSKKKSGEPIQFHNQSQLSNIQHKSEKCSFELQLPIDTTVKKPFHVGKAVLSSPKKDSGDTGLKYKPRSSINGRDDIRIRNMNQIHKKIIESLDKKRASSSQKSEINNFSSIRDQFLQTEYAKSQRKPNNSQLHELSLFDTNLGKRKQSKTSYMKSHRQKSQIPLSSSRLRPLRHKQQQNPQFSSYLNPQEFVSRIDPKSLINYLKRQPILLSSQSTPNQIYTFFITLCTNFGFKQHFEEPLIKRYKNCIYFGQKVPKDQSPYSGFVWYYRKALYYGEFQGGRKNGYGIEIDIEEQGNECIWRGTFLQGKKTGYFHMNSPNMQYNGSVKNSYFDGQGHLKTNKSIYQGSFQAGLKHGQGVQTFNHKVLTYRGEYVDNKFQGNGQLEGPNYFYKGQFQNNKIEGNGFERTDQFEYVGQFKDGQRHGHGIIKMSNGQVIEGLFKNGKIASKQQQKPKSLPKEDTAPHYQKSIPIQSFYRNSQLPPSFPSYPPNQFKNMSSTSYSTNSTNRNATFRSNGSPSRRNIVLQKHLSKQLYSLYQQNEQGTIQQERQKMNYNNYSNSKNSGFQLLRVKNDVEDQDQDEDLPLATRVLPDS